MKKLYIVAAILLVVGIVLSVVGLGLAGANMEDMFMGKYTEKTIRIQEDFNNIQIHTDTTDVVFSLSEDGSCQILCREKDHQPHTARVENGTLILGQENHKKWYHYIGFNIGRPSVEISLPKAAYENLNIEGSTGDVRIPKELQFANAQIQTSTGDVDMQGQVEKALAVAVNTGNILVSGVRCEQLNVGATTGEIRVLDVTCNDLTAKTSTGSHLLENVQVLGDIQVTCSTGDVHMTRVNCGNLFTESNTGEQILEYVVASGDASMQSNTGDILLTDFDAGNMVITTDTGSVTGTILTEKIFSAQTDTGKVEVPHSQTGGSCQITTDTGDIIIQIAQ